MRSAALTVHVSTKLNRSHVVHGGEALILPALGRSERDLTGGRAQRVTVEDSMSAVHASRGPLDRRRSTLRSEVDIICSLAQATLGERLTASRGRRSAPTTPRSADRIARVVPGCASYDEKVDAPGGFVLPHPPRDYRTFETPTAGRVFTVGPLDVLDVPAGPPPAADHAQARPVQHHDLRPRRPLPRRQGRAPGRLRQPRRPARPRARRRRARRPRQRVAGRHRAHGPVVPGGGLRQPRGCAAAYYPETNPLVPLDSTAEDSNQPVYKSIVVRLDRPGEGDAHSDSHGSPDQDSGSHRDDDPHHLS